LDDQSNFIRRIFDWQYSTVFGAGIWFGGLGAMLADKYMVALVFYTLGGLWLFGWWLVENPGPRRTARQREERRFTKKQRSLLWKQWGIAVVPLAITAGMCTWTWNLKVHKDLESLDGVLVPANDPYPDDISCAVPTGSLALIYGDSVIYADNNHLSILSVDTAQSHKELLSLERDKNGDVFLNADVRTADDRLVVSISKNHFEVNQNNVMDSHAPRPDRSTINLKDQYGHVLEIRYINRHAVRLVGTFSLTPTKSFTIGGESTGHNCFGGTILKSAYHFKLP